MMDEKCSMKLIFRVVHTRSSHLLGTSTGFYLIPTLNKAQLFDISVACPLANRNAIKALKSLRLRDTVHVCVRVCVSCSDE